MPVILIVRPKNGPVTTLSITPKPAILGRSSSCQIKLTDELISGKHLAVKLGSSGELLIKDLDTTNGSYLNGRQITQDKLYIGDELKIGDTILSIDPSELSPKEKRILTREGGGKPLEFINLERPDPSLTNTSTKKATKKTLLAEDSPTKGPRLQSQTEDTVAVQGPDSLHKSNKQEKVRELDLDEEIDLEKLKELQEQGELSEEEQTLLEDKIKRRVLERSRKVDDISRKHLGGKLGTDDEEYDLEKSSGETQMFKIDKKLTKKPKSRKELQETQVESIASKIKSFFGKRKTREEIREDEED